MRTFLMVLIPFAASAMFNHGAVYCFITDSIVVELSQTETNRFYSVTIGDSVYLLEGKKARFNIYLTDTFSYKTGSHPKDSFYHVKFELSTTTNTIDREGFNKYPCFASMGGGSVGEYYIPQYVKSNGSMKWFSGTIGATFATGTMMSDTIAIFYQDSVGLLTDTVYYGAIGSGSRPISMYHGFAPATVSTHEKFTGKIGSKIQNIRPIRNELVNLLGQHITTIKNFNGILLKK